MFGPPVAALAALCAVSAAVLILAGSVRVRRHPTRKVLDAALSHERTTSAVAGLLALLVIAYALSPVGAADLTSSTHTPGLLLAVAPPATAVLLLAVRAVGELTWPRTQGAVRTAALSRRSVRSLGEWRLTLFLVTVAISAVGLVVFGLTAGEGGRAVDAPIQVSPDGWSTGSSGPYPGWPYGVPLLVALAVVTLATLGVLKLVSRRAVVSGATAAEDDALRRLSAAHVLAGVQLLVGLGTAAVMLLASLALFSADRSPAAFVAFAVATAIGITSVVAGLSVLARHPAPAAPAAPQPSAA